MANNSWHIYIVDICSGYTVSLSSRKPSVSLTQKVYQIISKFEFFTLIEFFILKSYGVQKIRMFRVF
jgi:hypothetical protein